MKKVLPYGLFLFYHIMYKMWRHGMERRIKCDNPVYGIIGGMFKKPTGTKRYFLYFLRLEHGYFYTGITSNLERRVRQHQTGHGCVVTRAHKPIELIVAYDLGELEYSDAECIENEFTVYFMRLYGRKVRGGKWSRNKVDTKKVLENNPFYCPCDEFEMVAHSKRLRLSAAHSRGKSPKKKKQKMRFKNRQEQVDWVCMGH